PGGMNRFGHIPDSEVANMVGINNRSEQARICYPCHLQIISNTRRLCKIFREVKDINPAGGILDGKRVMFLLDRGDDALNFNGIALLSFLALEAVDFSGVN